MASLRRDGGALTSAADPRGIFHDECQRSRPEFLWYTRWFARPAGSPPRLLLQVRPRSRTSI